MTCCAEDIQFIGLKCKYENAMEIPHKSWVYVTAQIHNEFAKEYRGKRTGSVCKRSGKGGRTGRQSRILHIKCEKNQKTD